MKRIAAKSLLLATCWACTATPTPDTSTSSQATTVEDSHLVVPTGDGRPVLLDGLFTPGEWDDATTVVADELVTLRFKHHGGHVFIGVELTDLYTPIIDLFLESGDGGITQLHASAQLGERVLAGGDQEDPDFRWGMTRGWYANEVRWDQRARDSLEAAGIDGGEAILATMNPYDGFEVQILRTKLTGSEWRFRVEVIGGPDYETPRVYPAGTAAKETGDWMVLEFPAPGRG